MSADHVHAATGAITRELPEAVDIYDTTLRDGSQQEGLSLTVDDKLRVAEQLDHLGVHYIEGGWPGANPKDEEFFRRAAAGELHLHTATLVAFGSTRKAGTTAEHDPVLRHLLDAGTSAVCLVAKAAEWHVTETLRTSLTEAVDMVADSVGFLKAQGRRVFVDAEHFFDGYRANPGFSLDILRAAESAGAEVVILCDTNGGTLPSEAERVVGAVRDAIGRKLGCHFHNDTGCAVANSLIAVRQGCTQVQGCINGYGERTGNADLCATVPNLSLKMGVRTIDAVAAGAVGAGRPSHRRAGQHRTRPPPALRRGLCLRPQGGAARERHRPGGRRLPARGPRPGRQRDPVRGLGDGGPFHPETQGQPAGPRPRRRRTGRGAGQPEASRTPRLPLRSGRRLAGVADASRHRLEAGLLPARVVPGDHRAAAGRGIRDRGHHQGLRRR